MKLPDWPDSDFFFSFFYRICWSPTAKGDFAVSGMTNSAMTSMEKGFTKVRNRLFLYPILITVSKYGIPKYIEKTTRDFTLTRLINLVPKI